jgi:altronate dehydratase
MTRIARRRNVPLMSAPLPLHAVGRLPAPGDNVAIAIRQLEAGTLIALPDGPVALAHTVLEGHRFSVRAIAAGEPLLSWGETFGHALTPIAPGFYVCNQSILDWLVLRRIAATLPPQPNFADHLVPFVLDETTLRPAPPVAQLAEGRTFDGYARPGSRGVGTRNYIVILGTTSRTASFARQLTARLQVLARLHPSLDGIVAIAHTEGGGPGEPNNSAEILRALAGFMVHPNVGAILAVDYGVEPITNARLAAYARERNYALADVPHAFLGITHGLAAALAEGEAIVRGWLPSVAAERRTPQPVSALRIALQCGGSDAFSGVSGNPLAGAMVHEVVRRGGIGVLCETDELAGAESYLMKNVRDAGIARALLHRIARFKARLGWHGVTPESNPSAGNKLRGLYNITLKSLGAVHKKDPRTRIDHVIDYADPLTDPGFYFMDSPGNDLEGIAGQVGAGCNLFLFVTGNGSITNFPFVPTLKLTTTTRRHQLLVHEMDINAGRYLDGESFEALTAESFELLVATASGQRSRGELAGHSQAQLWRNWRQTDTAQIAAIRARPAPDGEPLPLAERAPVKPAEMPALALLATADGRFATERLGLVLPTSMCSAQIARLAADRMNANGLAARLGFSRFLALTHSEGCGFGGESMYHTLYRTYRGYATHPNVAATLLLEHGCEKIPNDVMRRQFEQAGIAPERFGWASVQLDGGIDRALAKIETWFASTSTPADASSPASSSPSPALAPAPAAAPVATTFGALTLGVLSAAPRGLSSATLGALVVLCEEILGSGGSVLVPESDALLANPLFTGALLGRTAPHATLAYGQPLTKPGLHVIQSDTDHWTENLAGLGASGAHLFVGLVGDTPQQSHPMLPLIQVAEPGALATGVADDVDLVFTERADANFTALGDYLAAVGQSRAVPVANQQGFVDFQLSRGLLGVST